MGKPVELCPTGQLEVVLRSVHTQGTTIILVEKNARAALQITNYGYVLENRKIGMFGETRDFL